MLHNIKQYQCIVEEAQAKHTLCNIVIQSQQVTAKGYCFVPWERLWLMVNKAAKKLISQKK